MGALVVIGLIVAAVLVATMGTRAAPEGGPLMAGAVPVLLPGDHNEWDDTIRQAVAAAGIPQLLTDRYAVLIKAIITHESKWDPMARGDYDPNACADSYRGNRNTAGWCALGLGQVHRAFNPDLAASYDLLDPAQNIQATAIYLARARRVVGDDPERLAAAYNGGQSMGLAWPNVPARISAYVSDVLPNYTAWVAEGGIA